MLLATNATERLVFVCLHRRILQHTFKERYLLEPEDSEPLACVADAIVLSITLFASLKRWGIENG